jgi:2-polyprenyl-3-methyl-5-hydroxy-6-metoxy-1,4-benzoquinol methylase
MSEAAHLRYRHKPFIGSSHTWALGRCAGLSAASRVLDIGCGSGSIGSALKGSGVKDLYAVEIDPAARANAANIYRKVEESVSAFSSQQFDLILLLDVLEHLTEPEKFLAEAAALLAPGGRILISVPNMTHWSIRLQILFGFFVYTERGILDKTHFRFFTRRYLKSLIKTVPSLSIEKLAASISPAEFVLPVWISNSIFFTWFSKFRLTGARIFPGLLAYQLLAEVKKTA